MGQQVAFVAADVNALRPLRGWLRQALTSRLTSADGQLRRAKALPALKQCQPSDEGIGLDWKARFLIEAICNGNSCCRRTIRTIDAEQKMNLLRKYRALTGADPADTELEFRFEGQPKSQLVQYKGTHHHSYLGRFVVSGGEELVRLGWECGFGEANSKGFGMAESIHR